MRIAETRRGIEPDIAERLDHPRLALSLRERALMHAQALRHDIADRHPRAQGSERVLKYDLHVATERPHLLETQTLDVFAQEHDRPVRRNQPQQRQTERGLAGPGFTDDAERLALAHLQRHAIHRLDMADRLAQQSAPDRKPDLEIVGRDHDRRFGARRRRIGLRLRGQKLARVGMLRRLEDPFDRSLLDDLATVHDANTIGDAADDTEIVGDEQQAHSEPGSDIRQQRQDLRLHGDVQRRGRLVSDQQVRFIGERHRDHHTLTLAAGQLVRIARKPGFRLGNADLRQQLQRAPPRRRTATPAVQQQDLADLGLDGVQRIERGHWLLKDDRDVVAANAPDLALRQTEQFAALEADVAAGVRRGRIGQQLEDRQRADGFSGSGFADQRHALAALDIERNAIDGDRRSAGVVKRDGEVANLEQRLIDGVHASLT